MNRCAVEWRLGAGGPVGEAGSIPKLTANYSPTSAKTFLTGPLISPIKSKVRISI